MSNAEKLAEKLFPNLRIESVEYWAQQDKMGGALWRECLALMEQNDRLRRSVDRLSMLEPNV